MRKRIIAMVGMLSVLLIACGKTDVITDENVQKTEEATEDSFFTFEYPTDEFRTYEREYDPDGDDDMDGLTNGEEEKLGTNASRIDTDDDGISDYDEVKVYFTNPLEADSDKDGITDAAEVMAGLDPMSARSNGVDDASQHFSNEIKGDGVVLTIEGDANVYLSAVEKSVSNRISKACYVSDVYDLHSAKPFESAKLEIKLNTNQIKNVDVNNLAIAWVKNDGELEVLDSEYNKSRRTISATLEHFSSYVVVDSSALSQRITDVYLVLDNSGSMFPKEVVEASSENDVDFKRVDMAKTLINELDGKAKMGISKFTGDYFDLSNGFDKSSYELVKYAESLKEVEEDFNGTAIAKALTGALAQFNESNVHKYDDRYIILLTDGRSTEKKKNSDINNAIKEAKDKKVKVIVIGLGNDIEYSYLNKIADKTGGMYIYAGSANSLKRVVDLILGQIGNGVTTQTDSKGDTYEGKVIADCGFDVKRDGFRFANYYIKQDGKIFTGQCTGISLFCQEYYLGLAKNSGEAIGLHQSGDKMLRGVAYSFAKSEEEYTELSHINKNMINIPGKVTYLYGDPYLDNKVPLYDFVWFPDLNQILAKTKSYLPEHSDTAKYEGDEVYNYVKKHSDLFIIEDIGEGITQKKDKFAHRDYVLYMPDADADPTSEFYQSQMLTKALNNYQAYQGVVDGKLTSYTLTPSLALNSYEFMLKEQAFEKLVDDLNNGIPVAIKSENTLFSSSDVDRVHTINAIRLIEEVDPKEDSIIHRYHLIVYDSNHPGEEKELIIEEKKWVGDLTNWYITDNDKIFCSEAGGNVEAYFWVTQNVRDHIK